jgi:hypothetical protein
MSDEQDVSEEFDPDELGDDPEGKLEFPGENYEGALDPGREDAVTDSYRSRTLRESVDEGEPSAIRLSGPLDESEEIGDAQEVDDASAEEAAVHIVDELDG